MKTLLTRKPKPRSYAEPDERRILETCEVRRCPVCDKEWEASVFVDEDGIKKCPRCVDERTASWKAETEARETEYAASRSEVRPQKLDGSAPLEGTFPGTIRKLTDANGVLVYQSAPLSLTRSVAKTLLLLGRSFSSSDTISGSTGLTIDVTTRTATQTDLSVTAGASMTPGGYDLIFNDVYFTNVFRVR